MKMNNVPNINAKKYNNWCHQRQLTCASEEQLEKAESYRDKDNLTQYEKAAFYAHELCGCEGLEFVAFSNMKFRKYTILGDNVILVPCFLIERTTNDIQSPLADATLRMDRNNRFVYDGWISITQWDEKAVRDAIRRIDEALSIFCLYTSTYFEWRPKYMKWNVPISYPLEEQKLNELEAIYRKIGCLDTIDRIAIYRSLAWLSQGIRSSDPIAGFLFFILSIESLITYIEKKASVSSIFDKLKADRLTKEKRKIKRENCIRDILSVESQYDLTKVINRAYVKCIVGIEQTLKNHIRKFFAPDVKPYNLLFEQTIKGKSLYELRHIVAHGTADVLSEFQRDQIRLRVRDAENLARKYLLTALKKTLNIDFVNPEINVNAWLDPLFDIIVMKGKVQSAHMADLYC